VELKGIFGRSTFCFKVKIKKRRISQSRRGKFDILTEISEEGALCVMLMLIFLEKKIK